MFVTNLVLLFNQVSQCSPHQAMKSLSDSVHLASSHNREALLRPRRLTSRSSNDNVFDNVFVKALYQLTRAVGSHQSELMAV